MRYTHWAAALALLTWAGLAKADPPAAAVASVDAPAMTLQGGESSDSDTELVWRHGGWGHYHGGWGGYHGGWGGYRGWGYGGWGGWGGYRGWARSQG